MITSNYKMLQKHESRKLMTTKLTKENLDEGWSLGRRGPTIERKCEHGSGEQRP